MSNTNKMLIDATHPEETRVVVLRNGRVEEFDFESAARKLLRGNIYLAKVTRVEPSLQAAFVEYGGNRHGFLAFNEIHPDYYQIPMADRQALLDEEAAAEAEEEAAVDAHAEALARRRAASSSSEDDDSVDVLEPREGGDPPPEDGDEHDHDHDGHGEPAHRTLAEAAPADDRLQAEPNAGEDFGVAANENTVDVAASEASTEADPPPAAKAPAASRDQRGTDRSRSASSRSAPARMPWKSCPRARAAARAATRSRRSSSAAR